MTHPREIILPAPVTGLSYRRPAASVTVALTLAVFAYGSRLLATAGELPAVLLLALSAGAVAMAMRCWFIVFGTTTVDAQGIRQAGMAPRSWHWNEIEQVRLVRMPWSTRLLLDTNKGRGRVVHAGTPALDEAFQVVARMYARRGY